MSVFDSMPSRNPPTKLLNVHPAGCLQQTQVMCQRSEPIHTCLEHRVKPSDALFCVERSTIEATPSLVTESPIPTPARLRLGGAAEEGA